MTGDGSGRTRTAETQIDDLGAVVGRVADAARDVVVEAAGLARAAEHDVPVAGEHLDRHQPDVERDARRADAVVGQLADRAADVRAVAVEIERRGAATDEITRRDESARRRPAVAPRRTGW